MIKFICLTTVALSWVLLYISANCFSAHFLLQIAVRAKNHREVSKVPSYPEASDTERGLELVSLGIGRWEFAESYLFTWSSMRVTRFPHKLGLVEVSVAPSLLRTNTSGQLTGPAA